MIRAPMFRSCPLTGDNYYGWDSVENDPRLLECMQGWHSGINEGGTKSCSLSIYTTGRVVLTMDAESLEIPAGKLDYSRYVNHISLAAKPESVSGLSYAYFKSESVEIDRPGIWNYGPINIFVSTDRNGLAYADAWLSSAAGNSQWLDTCVFR